MTEIKIAEYKKALKSLSAAIEVYHEKKSSIDDPKLIDVIENGIAQKFEYTVELMWKAFRDVFYENDGLEINSPKKVIKTLYQFNHINDDMFIVLIDMIDDKNKILNIHDEQEFHQIIEKINTYKDILESLGKII